MPDRAVSCRHEFLTSDHRVVVTTWHDTESEASARADAEPAAESRSVLSGGVLGAFRAVTWSRVAAAIVAVAALGSPAAADQTDRDGDGWVADEDPCDLDVEDLDYDDDGTPDLCEGLQTSAILGALYPFHYTSWGIPYEDAGWEVARRELGRWPNLPDASFLVVK
jgi:hypothetical protein